jgi:hypothetical protein
MRTALGPHDRDIANIRRRMHAARLLYALACALPAASFLALIIVLWSAQ